MSVDSRLSCLYPEASAMTVDRCARAHFGRPAGVRGPVAWLTSGALSIQMTAVAIGCALSTWQTTGLRYRFVAIAIPLLFVAAAHPAIQRIVISSLRGISDDRERWPLRKPRPFGSASMPRSRQAKRPDHMAAVAREGLLLRTFDRFEEILQEALTLEVGRLAANFQLGNTVERLLDTGFLTPQDFREWTSCLAVRRGLLLAGSGLPMPGSAEIENALATMLKLQVNLADRRRCLVERERRIGQQEEQVVATATKSLD